jgi:hypothetical protein
MVHRNIVLAAVRSEFMDAFEELLDRWADLDQETGRSCCGHCEVGDGWEAQIEAEDLYFHRAADASFF